MSSVVDIIIENFLKDVEEKGTMPWQRPYEVITHLIISLRKPIGVLIGYYCLSVSI